MGHITISRGALAALLIGMMMPFLCQSADKLAEGKALYNGPGSCVACHMVDGKGQPGSVPPLVGSDWLKDSPDRTIAIVLRGLAGPVKVNGKRFYSAMPPQLLFNDEQLAAIITYVNKTWGKGAPEVSAQQIAKARAELPADVYTADAILKAFPFPRAMRKRNGTFKPDFDDALTDVLHPVVYRTFMPGASPAAFAVALPGNQFYCWDAGECRLRYAWNKGGFIRGNQLHWSSNGKPVANFNGTPYYRARTSLLKPEDYEVLAKTDRQTPFYDTTQAEDFPLVLKGTKDKPAYKGYRLIDGFPEFRYQVGKHLIRELITTSTDQLGIVRTFSIEPPVQTTLHLTPDAEAILSSSNGKISKSGKLTISAKQSRQFSVIITEKNPTPKAASGGFE